MRNLGLAVCFLFLTACASKPAATTDAVPEAAAAPAAVEKHDCMGCGKKKGCTDCADTGTAKKEKKSKPCGCKE